MEDPNAYPKLFSKRIPCHDAFHKSASRRSPAHQGLGVLGRAGKWRSHLFKAHANRRGVLLPGRTGGNASNGRRGNNLHHHAVPRLRHGPALYGPAEAHLSKLEAPLARRTQNGPARGAVFNVLGILLANFPFLHLQLCRLRRTIQRTQIDRKLIWN